MSDIPEILSNLNFIYESRHSLAPRWKTGVFLNCILQHLVIRRGPCLLFDRPEILSNQSFVYESRRSLARHEYLQEGQQQFLLSDVDIRH